MKVLGQPISIQVVEFRTSLMVLVGKNILSFFGALMPFIYYACAYFVLRNAVSTAHSFSSA
jgi:hypothetical protein